MPGVGDYCMRRCMRAASVRVDLTTMRKPMQYTTKTLNKSMNQTTRHLKLLNAKQTRILTD
jgi:hypothetical protein